MNSDWQEEAWRYYGAIGDEMRAAVDEYLATLSPAQVAMFHIQAKAQSDLLIHGEAFIEYGGVSYRIWRDQP